MKLALYAVIILSLIGGIFYLVKLGQGKEQAKQLQREADAARDDIYIKQKQDKIISNRDNYDIVDRLRKGGF